MSSRILRPGIDLLERGHLRRSEATVGVGALAEQSRWVEVALPRVIEDTVRYTVLGVAGSKHSGADGRDLGRRNVTGLIQGGSQANPHSADQQVCPKIGGGAGKDAVVIFGESAGPP